MKILLVGTEHFHVDGRTDGQQADTNDEAHRRFSQFFKSA